MAFNADEYIDVIVDQIAQNFKALDETVKNKDKPSVEDEAKFFILDKDINDFVDMEYHSMEPLSVGLFGEWGSGKTHLLKMIQYKINELQSEKLDTFPQVTIPIFFNAWRFEKEEHLIIPLFQTMLAQMQEYKQMPLSEDAKKFLRHSYKKMKILSKSLLKGLKLPDNFIESASKVVCGDITFGKDVVDAKKIVDEYKDKTKEEFEHEKLLKELLASERLQAIYYQIPQWIEKIAIFDKINFVFLIDDLDRCLPENTLKMLESIKLFLDVPSCSFVLAIDDDIVERGVEHHYRYYLKKEKELPITGHEYLEKMIQLPFRIPVIDTDNIRQYLRDNYMYIFDDIDEKLANELLDFFAKATPPKPRKIKRVAMLFDTKIKILKKLKISPIDYTTVAKITLLELFAPKLLRFIQNNGYRRVFHRLVDFRELDKNKPSLGHLKIIDEHIEGFDDKEQELFTRLVNILRDNYSNRMVFELDYIFDIKIENKILKENIELICIKEEKDFQKEETRVNSATFMEKLFRPDDSTSWKDAFEDDELFAEGKALLEESQIQEIQTKANKKKGFCDNPIWLGVVAEYITQDQFIQMLDNIYPYKMESYCVTFEEYDRYCEDKNIEKPNDEGWGREKRPVINVSWNDADDYAKWMSDKKGVEYRLPSEDEWYLACNVGKKSEWHFEYNANFLKGYAWYKKNSQNQTHPVGEKKPNALGLYDMHGNVWEWSDDWYDEDEKEKVLLGGSWGSDANWTRSSNHHCINPDIRDNYTGFRLLGTLPS